MTLAPNSLAARIASIPGVAAVQPGISVQVTLDIPSMDEPASGNVRSLPDFGRSSRSRWTLVFTEDPVGASLAFSHRPDVLDSLAVSIAPVPSSAPSSRRLTYPRSATTT